MPKLNAQINNLGCERCFNSSTTMVDAVSAFKRFVAKNALKSHGSVDAAADILNLAPSTLRRLLKSEMHRILRLKR